MNEDNPTAMRRCREAIVLIRGSHLDSPCYCDVSDPGCLKNRLLMMPTNPCIERVAINYRMPKEWEGRFPGNQTNETNASLLGAEGGGGLPRNFTKWSTTNTTTTTTTVLPLVITAAPAATTKDTNAILPTAEYENTSGSNATTSPAMPDQEIGEESRNQTSSEELDRDQITETTTRSHTTEPLVHKKRKHFRVNPLPTGDYVAQSPPSAGGTSQLRAKYTK